VSPKRVGRHQGPRSAEQGFDSTQRYCSTEDEPEPQLAYTATDGNFDKTEQAVVRKACSALDPSPLEFDL
jgi:hypothetical protein